MATYKTPGVYVEEISKLPPSVAQVETALPAFIGFTQKAQDISPNDLSGKPTRIGSLVEFELFFGVGPEPHVTEINIDSNNNFLSAKVENKFFLYDSLRLFFSNGGGDCYIVSIGNYQVSTIDAATFTMGIDALEKEDNPTILLFPDAVELDDDQIAAVQQAALAQCQDLQDRVALLDVRKEDPLGVTFREKVGINFLSYGAAYTPWLKVSLPKKVNFPDVQNIMRSGIAVSLSGLTADPEIQTKISAVEQAYADKENIAARTTALASPNGILAEEFASLEAAFNASNSDVDLQNFFQFLYEVANQIDRFIKGSDPEELTLRSLKDDVTSAVNSNLDPSFAKVASLEKEVGDKIAAYTPLDVAPVVSDTSSWNDFLAATTTASDLIPATADTDDKKRISALNSLRIYFNEISTTYYSLIVNAAANYAKTTDESLALAFPVYKTILNGIAKSMTSMPPSGAVAGLYAMVDRTRGVWKSPANVSLSNVVAPEVSFTKSELDGLNVDPVAGKSINAIRTFFGKGTLVFGARTLAGNDNEWRYISVRRFFNMVEESCKKSTEMFVFEPNDANTWVRVQGMIENFLSTMWRQGALQGAKPEHAFYVAVGLGKTMTSLDILEGRMIVEIGMAVVRPAEFIILRFSHKLAES